MRCQLSDLPRAIARIGGGIPGALAFLFFACGVIPWQQPGGMSLHYSLEPASIPDKTLSVTLRINRFPDTKTRLRLFKGSVALSDLRCLDARKRDVVLCDDGGLIDLEPLRNAMPATITYTAALGGPGRHGHCGGLYPDLTVFDGEHALVLPEVTVNGSDSAISFQISRIRIELNCPDGWTSRVPYPVSATSMGRCVTEVVRPSFFAVSQLVKSPFVAGMFIRATINGTAASVDALIDPVVAPIMTDTVRQAVAALCDFHANVFGSMPPGLALVFLRPDSGDGARVMGGVGMAAVASTFDPEDKRDWELLSHRLFHAFFDAKMPVSLFRKKPQLWLYEGLATYYENVALGQLPEALRHRLNIDVDANFRALGRRYAYLRVKDPRLAIPPMDEAKASSSGVIEFLHYTQAPLIVKLLEDQGCARFGGRDRLLGFVMANYTTMTSIEPAVSFGVVEDHDAFLRKYLFGSDILPVWLLGRGEEDSAVVLRQLSDFGHSMEGWFRDDGSPGAVAEPAPLDSTVTNVLDSVCAFSPEVCARSGIRAHPQL